MNKEYDIDSILSGIDFQSNKFNTINNNIMLTNKEIEVLERYDIKYKKCSNLKEVIFEIENIIDEYDDIEELDEISKSIAERDYYQNTNK